jgi:hypothetical protein
VTPGNRHLLAAKRHTDRQLRVHLASHPMAGLVVDVARDDRAHSPSYLLHCQRFSRRSPGTSLIRLGDEFGLERDRV